MYAGGQSAGRAHRLKVEISLLRVGLTISFVTSHLFRSGIQFLVRRRLEAVGYAEKRLLMPVQLRAPDFDRKK